MNFTWAYERFRTIYVSDNKDGYAGIRLYRVMGEHETLAAEVIFWDAIGQYVVQTFGEVPLTVLERAIAEAKGRVKVA
jgi:hypothetical protein